MRKNKQTWVRGAESGAALLIAIFALLLISVVAIALVVSSGTDAALGGNYRTSTAAYFAGVAGLEEARGRLLAKNPNCLVNPATPNCPIPPNPSFIPVISALPAMGLNDVRYILNPAGGETVDPLSANPANYPDTEYATEFTPLAAANVITTPSTAQTNVAGLPGPSYKWVRINPATETSLNLDVDGNGSKDNWPDGKLLYYDPTQLIAGTPSPGLISSLPPRLLPQVQVLEITSLSVLPNGSKRLLQYVVAPVVISPYMQTLLPTYLQFTMPPGANQPSVPAALTLLGSNPTFQISSTPNYPIDGRDACSGTTPQAAINSVGYTSSADYAAFLGQMNPNKNEYPGYPLTLSGPPPGTYKPTTPSLPGPPLVSSVPQNWQTPATLDAVVQSITTNADVVITGAASSSTISSRAPTMSATNPMTVVVNGDLNLNANVGYGLLLVTGTLTYQPFASWNGLVLVIGKGAFTYNSTGGSGGIQGAVVVAATRDGSGNLLSGTALGSPSFTSNGTNSNLGIMYNSCWVQSAQGPLTYRVLSFREIPLAN